MTSRSVTILRAVLFLVACPVVLVAAGPVARKVAPAVNLLVVGAVASACTFLLTVIFLRWDGLRLRDVGAGWEKGSPVRFLTGFAIGMSIVGLQDLTIYAGGHTHWVAGDAQRASWGAIGLAFAGYLLLALREELAFRGYALRRLESAWGMWGALLFAGLFFTLEHTAGGWSWKQALLGPPAGALLFGMAALATRGLAVPLGIHAAFNFGQWMMGQKETTGVWTPVVDTGFSGRAETLGYAGYLAGMFIATVGFWLWKRRRDTMQSFRINRVQPR